MNEKLVKYYDILTSSRYFTLLLTIGLFLFGHNEFFNFLGVVLLTSVLVLFIDKDEFLVAYFALLFFESILGIPYIGGSFFRIYQILFIFKVIREFKTRKFLDYFNLNYIAASLFFTLTFLFITDIEAIFSFFINIFIIIYIVNSFRTRDFLSYYGQLFRYITIFVLLSSVYSFIFMQSIDYDAFSRATGITRDPNSSSLFYTLGVFALFGSDIKNRYIKLILFLTLIYLLVGTVSISGIVGTIILLFGYLWIIKPQKALILSASVVVIFVIFMNATFAQGDFLYGLQYRIGLFFVTNDLNFLTSGRFNLISFYLNNFKNLPLIEQIFGGNNILEGSYNVILKEQIGSVSHMAYVDMLHMIGIFGTLLVIIVFIAMIMKNILAYKKTSELTYLSLAFIKVAILYYGLTLSIFPFRYFYVFFIL